MKKKQVKRKPKTNPEPEIDLFDPFSLPPIVFKAKTIRGRFILSWFFFVRSLSCLFKGKASV